MEVFERAENGHTVSSWQGKSVGSMRTEWDGLILSSRGSSCAGAELRADLDKRGFALKPSAETADASNVGTLTSLVAENGYMRMSIYDPCE